LHSVGSLLISLGVIFLAALVCDVLGRRTWLPRVTLLMSSFSRTLLDIVAIDDAWGSSCSAWRWPLIFELVGPIATRVALRGAARESGTAG